MPETYIDPEEEQLEREAEADENSDAQKNAAKTVSTWFTRDSDAKDFYVKEMDENDKLRTLKHWDLLGPTGNPLRSENQQAVHPNAIDPVVNALVEGFVAEFAQDVELVDYPMEEGDDDAALIMSDMKQYIAYKNRLPIERLKWLGNFAWHGTGIWKHVFDPTWIGGEGPNRWAGDIRWQSRHPRYVFPDHSCGEDIHSGRRIHDARYVTKEYLEDKYPEYAALVQMGMIDTTLMSTDESEATSTEGQTERTLLVETWYIGKPLLIDKQNKEKDEGKGLHCIWWCGEENPIYLRHANYLNFKPGSDPKFPFTFSQCYLRDGSCWGRGQAYFVKQLQIMINKVEDVKMEAIIHQTLGQTFFTQGALSAKQQQYVRQTGTLAGNYIEVNELEKIKRVWGAGIPGSVMDEPARLQRSAENALGRYDVSVGRSPVSGSASSFKALALLDQRAQVRLRPIDVIIKDSYEQAGQYLNRLIWKHYTEQRAYRIIGRNEETGQDVVKKRGVFQMNKLRKINDLRRGQAMMRETEGPDGQMMSVPMREADLTPEFKALKGAEKLAASSEAGLETETPPVLVEGEDYEIYEPELDVKVRTSVSMPSERFFWIETAKELLTAGMIDLQIFAYVLEHGRFPPWSIIKRVMAERAAMMAQNQPQEQTQGSGGLPPGGRWTYTAQFKDPAAVEAITQQAEGATGAVPGQPGDVELNPAVQELLAALPEDKRRQFLSQPAEVLRELNDLPPDQIRSMMMGDSGTPGPREWTAKGGTVPM